jgi:hypothetical protein
MNITKLVTDSKVRIDTLSTVGLEGGIGKQDNHIQLLLNYLAWASRGLFSKEYPEIKLKKPQRTIRFLRLLSRYPV